MSSGTFRISWITFPAFCRRSCSVFASPAFFAESNVPDASRPPAKTIQHFVYFITCASLSALVFLKQTSFFVSSGLIPRIVGPVVVGGNSRSRLALNLVVSCRFNGIRKDLRTFSQAPLLMVEEEAGKFFT